MVLRIESTLSRFSSWARCCAKYKYVPHVISIKSSQQTGQLGTITIPILEMKKFSFREAKSLNQS